MRHSCSVPPPPSAASSETLSIVHGSCGFHWKSTTCGKEGMAKGWDWKGGIVQEGSDKPREGKPTHREVLLRRHGLAGHCGCSERTGARWPACWKMSCCGAATLARFAWCASASDVLALQSQMHTSLHMPGQGRVASRFTW